MTIPMVSKVQKNSPWKIKMVTVRAIPNLVLSPQQNCFVDYGKQI